MIYDCLDYSEYGEEDYKFFTIGDMIDACNQHPEKKVKFVGTNYTVGQLQSWRGSYDIPSITYLYGDYKLAKEVADQLELELQKKHCGYKGGEYHFYAYEEFYVAQHGSSSEWKVVDAKVEGEFLVLGTKLDPY